MLLHITKFTCTCSTKGFFFSSHRPYSLKEMNTLKNHPELMDRIINIQNLKAIIEPNYNRFSDFEKLEKMTGDELWDIQNKLIVEYNKSFTK